MSSTKLVLFGLIAACTAGIGIIRAQSSVVDYQFPPVDRCPSLSGVTLTDDIRINTSGIVPEFTEVLSARLPIKVPGAEELVAHPRDPAVIGKWMRCLGNPPYNDPGTQVSTSVAKQIVRVTFTRSFRLPYGYSDQHGFTAWHATSSGREIRLRLDPRMCRQDATDNADDSIANWRAAHLTLTVQTDITPFAVSPLPISKSGNTYSWSSHKKDCAVFPRVYLAVPMDTVTALTTAVYHRHGAFGPLRIEAIGWAELWIMLIIALVLLNRIKTTGHVRFKGAALLGVAAAGVLLASISADRAVQALALVVGVHAFALLALAPVMKHFKVYVAAAALSILAGIAIYVGASDPGLGLAILAVLQLLAIGRALCAHLAALLPVPSQIKRWIATGLGAVAIAALGYDLGNYRVPGNDFPFSAHYSVRYAIAAHGRILVALALLLPLILSRCRSPQAFAALVFGWALVVELPAARIGGLYVPLAQAVCASLVYVLVRRSPPRKDTSNAAARIATSFPHYSRRANAYLAVRISAVLAIAPVSFFLYSTFIQLPNRLRDSGSLAAFVISGVVTEIVRWVGTGLFYAAASLRLPGRIGPVRTLGLSAAWFAGALAVRVGGTWTGADAGRNWTFPGLQLLLFLLAFSVVWDGFTTRATSWTEAVAELREAYHLQQTRAVVLYAVPVVLALLAIGEQIRNGSAVDFIQAVLNAAPPIAGG